MDNESPASSQRHGRGSFFRGCRIARQRSRASRANSVRWPVLRTRWWMSSTWACGICGNSQCRNGSKNLEVCSYDLVSLEAEKITASQTSGGSQYFNNIRNFGTPDESRIPAARQSEIQVRPRFVVLCDCQVAMWLT